MCLIAHVWVCAACGGQRILWGVLPQALSSLFVLFMYVAVCAHVCGGAHEGQSVSSYLLRAEVMGVCEPTRVGSGI